MVSVFTRIINGELPARFVWDDEKCVAFLSIAPVRPGHLLVVPKQEVDHWIDGAPELNEHLMRVSQQLARVLQEVFQPSKVALSILGLEVPHLHLHLVPIRNEGDMDFAKADANAKAEEMDAAAEAIRTGLRAAGHTPQVRD